MNRALFWQSLRSLTGSVPRMLLVIAGTYFPVVQQALSADSAIALPNPAYPLAPLLAMTCAADARNGLLRTILGRPVERWRYLVMRFAAGWALATALLFSAILASACVSLAIDDGARIPPMRLAQALVVLAAAIAPLVAFFVAGSAILPPFGDVVVFVAMIFGYQFLVELRPLGWELLVTPFALLRALVVHEFPGGPVANAIVALAHAAALLGIGVVAFSRRQVPAEARA